jgi:hypothetical protein
MTEPPDFEPFNPHNPYTQVLLLAQRVETLGKEKEALERDLRQERLDRLDLAKRVSTMENSYQRGAGILIGLSFLGGIVGLLAANWKTIFRPWS